MNSLKESIEDLEEQEWTYSFIPSLIKKIKEEFPRLTQKELKKYILLGIQKGIQIFNDQLDSLMEMQDELSNRLTEEMSDDETEYFEIKTGNQIIDSRLTSIIDGIFQLF